MKDYLIFLKNSLDLDLRTISFFPWNSRKKIEFICKKYYEIFKLKSGLKKFILGKSHVRLFNKDIYYDSSFGLAVYQSMYARLGKLIMKSNLKDIKTVIDIGANVGLFSLMIKDLYPKSKIYPIEPIKDTYECLLKNLKDLENIFPFQIAISKISGTRYMEFNKNDSLISKLIDKSIFKVKNKGIEKVKVISKSLDDFYENNKLKIIDLLKIDAETFELEVLQGSMKSLEKTRYVLIEITIENNNNYTFSELVSILYNENYNFQLIAFRNYLDKGDGVLPVGDFLFENISLLKNNQRMLFG